MLRQVFRSLKNVDEWYTKDGEEIINLGKSLGYGNGNDLIFKHPVTGEEITARYGTTDKNGEFLRFCQYNDSRAERISRMKDKDLSSRAGYYLDF